MRYALEAVVLPLVIVIRLISPLVLIRFGRLHGHLGHLLLDTEAYLCVRDLSKRKRRVLDFFDTGARSANRQVVKMWRRQMRISRVVAPFWYANRRLPGYQRHEVPPTLLQDVEGLLCRAPTHLLFTTEEEDRGRRELVKLGVPDGAQFVCFHVRDAAYWAAANRAAAMPGYDRTASEWRNADVQTFVPAARELARRGYTVLRMGSIVEKPLGDVGPGVIDYASSPVRSEFLDVYLPGRCRFFLGTPSGPITIPMVLRRPLAQINCIPLGFVVTWGPQGLYIPKKLWLRSEQRFMSLWEVLQSPIGWPHFSGGSRPLHTSDQYRDAGIEIVNNTAEEITALAIEMDERLNGTWEGPADQDEPVQSLLRKLMDDTRWHGRVVARLGSGFIRQNPELVRVPTPALVERHLPPDALAPYGGEDASLDKPSP